MRRKKEPEIISFCKNCTHHSVVSGAHLDYRQQPILCKCDIDNLAHLLSEEGKCKNYKKMMTV